MFCSRDAARIHSRLQASRQENRMEQQPSRLFDLHGEGEYRIMLHFAGLHLIAMHLRARVRRSPQVQRERDLVPVLAISTRLWRPP